MEELQKHVLLTISVDGLAHSVQGKGGLKPATAVNVRHILCEKHSKAMEALSKLQVRSTLELIFSDALKTCQEGQRFDKVAQEYSEDKAKGESRKQVNRRLNELQREVRLGTCLEDPWLDLSKMLHLLSSPPQWTSQPSRH